MSGAPWERYAQQSVPAEAMDAPPWEKYAAAVAPAPAPEQPGILASLGRGVGLGTRAAIQGIGALPGMVYDAARVPGQLITAGINAATGANIPAGYSSRDILTGAADVAGLPKPETDGEKLTSAVVQNVAGVVPAMGAGVAAGKVATPMMQAIARALTGAPVSQVTGAAAGGYAGELANQAGWGPAGEFGAALAGGVAGAAVPGLASALRQGAGALVQPFSQAGREKIIAEALLRNSTEPETLAQRLVAGADDTTRRLPGSPVTSAVAARDPQMMLLESGLRSDVQTVPGSMSPAAALRDVDARRNVVRGQAMDTLQRGGLPDATARGGAVQGALDAAETGMKARTDQLFDIARDRNPNRYPANPVLDKAREATRMFDPAQGGEGVPAALQGVIDDIANLERLDISQAQNLRSRLGTIAGEASRAGNNRLASAAGAISASLEQQIDDPRWMAAVAQRREQGQALGRDMSGAAATGAIGRTDRYGAPLMTSDQAIKKAIETPQAARQVLDAGYKALDDARRARLPTEEIEALSQNVKTMRQAMRDQFADSMRAAASTTSDIADATGAVSRQLSPAQFARWWEKNQRVADVLFDGAERRTLDRLAADFRETSVLNTARARGSDTAQNLSVGNFIARLTGGIVDPQNPLAQSLGNLGPVANWIVRAPEQAMREMMVQALRDPKFAAQLTQKADPQSMARALLYWQKTMPERVADAATSAVIRETPRIGLAAQGGQE